MNFFRMHRPTTDLDRNHCGNTNRNNDSKSSALMDESITATVEVVGTERVAKNALAANAKKYKYPVAGFRNKIEYSLLYSMMNSPGIYPLDVILDMIIAEDYTQYFYFNDATASDSYSHNSIDSVTTNHDPDATGGSSTNDSSVRPFCPPASYAQLVALLLVAVRHFPPPSSAPQEIADDDDEDDDEYEAFNRRRRFQRRQQQPKGKTETKSAVLPTTTTTTRPTVVQALCQSMVQVITQHCEKFDLCPQKEILDFFGMFYENTAVKKTRRDLTLMTVGQVTFYTGLTAFLLTGGGIPMIVLTSTAFSMGTLFSPLVEEKGHQNSMSITHTLTNMRNDETIDLISKY